MKISQAKNRIIHCFAKSALNHFVKDYATECSIVSARVAHEVLTKHHFKVKPLTVEVKIYNDLYIQKGRNPESPEEFNEWIAEGAIAIQVPDHVVTIINEEKMLDLSISKSTIPEGEDGNFAGLLIPPVICDAKPEFLSGQKPIFVENTNFVMIYDALPDNTEFMKSRDWFDKEFSKEIVKEIAGEVKELLKVLKEHKIK